MLIIKIKEQIVLFFATGTYLGYLPKAPGTFGTLWGIPFFYVLSKLSPLFSLLVLLVGTVFAIFISSLASTVMDMKDPGSIVIDEIIGYGFAVFMLPFNLKTVVLTFIFFRIFDIAKPWPIKLADEKIKGGTGIVIDDIMAGIFTCIIVHIIIKFWK